MGDEKKPKVRIQLGQGSAAQVTSTMLKNEGVVAFYKASKCLAYLNLKGIQTASIIPSFLWYYSEFIEHWVQICNPAMSKVKVDTSSLSFLEQCTNYEKVPPVFLDVHLDHFVLDSKQLLVQKELKDGTWASQPSISNSNVSYIDFLGLSLLKIGGRMVYCTCSMNPVENESVVAEVVDT
ncbi:hypothetical protein RIF29_33661 [Crotalaria pallida]|uniref:SAM-dependent MTase RsmB/NOP-type domain-containing protein n=1 Tax=Crotalaria pallida TaxID=3830 RepID=A0AAN9HWY2_CROPI